MTIFLHTLIVSFSLVHLSFGTLVVVEVSEEGAADDSVTHFQPSPSSTQLKQGHHFWPCAVPNTNMKNCQLLINVDQSGAALAPTNTPTTCSVEATSVYWHLCTDAMVEFVDYCAANEKRITAKMRKTLQACC